MEITGVGWRRADRHRSARTRPISLLSGLPESQHCRKPEPRVLGPSGGDSSGPIANRLGSKRAG